MDFLSHKAGTLLIYYSKHIDGARPQKTPICKLSDLFKYVGSTFHDPTLSCSVVGVLQYTTITRPDIHCEKLNEKNYDGSANQGSLPMFTSPTALLFIAQPFNLGMVAPFSTLNTLGLWFCGDKFSTPSKY